jgi:hypothetical protein
MRDWGSYDVKQALFCGNGVPGIFSYVPESFFGDLIESFECVIHVNQRQCKAFTAETAVAVLEFCLATLRTDNKFITNPYTKAKALELMALFVRSDTKNEFMNYYNNSEVISKFFMETVIKFYVDIEFAG